MVKRPAVEDTLSHLLITGASQVLTCVPTGDDPSGPLPGAAVAIAGERILAVGPETELRRQYDLSGAQVLDATGKIIAPGYIDCHTHLVFGGSRAREYGARMTMSAAEVRALGIPTGIQATVEMTRAASFDELYASASRRLARMFRHGTTTVESKSGYGLTAGKEMEMLAVNRRLHEQQPVDVVSTFLGAHDFPPELPRESYLDLLVEEMIPRVAGEGLAEFCDVYCDQGYYTVSETRRILQAGLDAGLGAKIHVDAYANIGGAGMAADLGAVSADHLNYTRPAGARALAQAGTIGVVMPALDFAVRHPRPFNAQRLRDEGLALALATDICPGCWVESMQFVMQLACRLYAFSPAEALHASTTAAARALGLAHDRGSIVPGMLADLQIWKVPTLDDVIYRLGNNAVEAVVKRGRIYHWDQQET